QVPDLNSALARRDRQASVTAERQRARLDRPQRGQPDDLPTALLLCEQQLLRRQGDSHQPAVGGEDGRDHRIPEMPRYHSLELPGPDVPDSVLSDLVVGRVADQPAAVGAERDPEKRVAFHVARGKNALESPPLQVPDMDTLLLEPASGRPSPVGTDGDTGHPVVL